MGMMNGYKTYTAIALAVIYAAGLLFSWWGQNHFVEGFVLLLFGVGGGHKVVKYRRHKKESEIAYRDNPHGDDPRRYESVEDLLDRED